MDTEPTGEGHEMGVRAWWQRVWRRWTRPDANTETIGEVRARGKDQIARFDTRARGGSRL